MADVLFISESYYKEMSGTNENTDFKLLRPVIIAVQDMYIQKILGTSLYNDLKTKLTNDVTLASYPNEKGLIDNYISKVLVWYIKMESGKFLQYQYMNKAIITKNLDNGNPIDKPNLNSINNEWRNYAELYANELKRYLQINVALFPKYGEISIAGMNPSQRTFTNGIYMKNYYGEENKPQKGVNGSDIILD